MHKKRGVEQLYENLASLDLSRRDALSFLTLISAALLTSCLPLSPRSEPVISTRQPKPTFEPTPTDEPFPETLPEQAELLTREWHEKLVKEREEFWGNHKKAAKLFRLSKYQTLHPNQSERMKQVETMVNSPWVNIVICGTDGQDGRGDLYKDNEFHSFDYQNSDAPISIYFNCLTGKSVLLCLPRSLTLARGINFTGMGDTLNQMTVTSSPNLRVLGESDPIENVKDNLTIMTGIRPDRVMLMNMDGFRGVMEKLVKDKDKELAEVRDRQGTWDGNRSLKAAKLGRKILEKQAEMGLPLTNKLGLGILDIAAKILDQYASDVMFDGSGNLLTQLLPVLRQNNLSGEQTQILLNNIIDNQLFLRVIPSDVALVKNELTGISDYPVDDLLSAVREEMGKERDMDDPYAHDFAVLTSTKSRKGHLNDTMIPLTVNHERKLTIDWNLFRQGVKYDEADRDESELEKLMQFWALFRTIFARYVPID